MKRQLLVFIIVASTLAQEITFTQTDEITRIFKEDDENEFGGLFLGPDISFDDFFNDLINNADNYENSEFVPVLQSNEPLFSPMSFFKSFMDIMPSIDDFLSQTEGMEGDVVQIETISINGDTKTTVTKNLRNAQGLNEISTEIFVNGESQSKPKLPTDFVIRQIEPTQIQEEQIEMNSKEEEREELIEVEQLLERDQEQAIEQQQQQEEQENVVSGQLIDVEIEDSYYQQEYVENDVDLSKTKDFKRKFDSNQKKPFIMYFKAKWYYLAGGLGACATLFAFYKLSKKSSRPNKQEMAFLKD